MKTCYSCKETKPLEEFGRSKRNKDGASSYCLDCGRKKSADQRKKLKEDDQKYAEHKANQAAKMRQRRLADPEKYAYTNIRTADEHRWYRIWNRYKLTKDDSIEILENQDWSCLICSSDIDTDSFVVDHDHGCCPGRKSCGKCVRGFLCQQCNKRLGFIEGDEQWLKAASDYLEANRDKC